MQGGHYSSLISRAVHSNTLLRSSSIAQDEIPFKLRCAICNKLAVNAFRLPCCDQAICEGCKCCLFAAFDKSDKHLGQNSLPDTCPVCEHTPLSSDLCKPNKALRTTLKAFLRTEEKKREKERQAALPATPEEATPAEEPSVKKEPEQEPNLPDNVAANGGTVPDTTEGPSGTQPVDNEPPAAAEPSTPNAQQDGANGDTQVVSFPSGRDETWNLLQG